MTTRATIKLPGVSSAVSQVVIHFVTVFGVAFGTVLLAGWDKAVNIGSVEALFIAAATAGVAAVLHMVVGLVPNVNTGPAGPTNALGVTLDSSKLWSVVVSFLVTFATLFGTTLLAGGAGFTSVSTWAAAATAAIAGAVAAVVHYLTGLIPAPAA